MNIEVYKFGGASVADSNKIDNVRNILQNYKGEKLIVVISAIGKTTNALEEVLNAYFNKTGDPYEFLNKVKEDHVQLIKDLDIASNEVMADLNDTFVEIEWILEEEVNDPYDYLYDQLVSVGELLSTKIVNHYIAAKGVNSTWMDVRDVLLTDNTYTEANLDWTISEQRIKQTTQQLFEDYDIIITQGFIGSSSENFTTTFGREGSDYTAGIFSYCLDASSMAIWKDVPGILTGDPRIFDNVSLIKRLDYREAIEMTYFGAKVIHPKTIKPLQNKNIPLFVRPFNDPEAEGTMITSDVHTQYPPVVVIEPNQTMLHISTKDFSFVAEQHLSEIFDMLNKRLIKVNMMRNTAISFSVSVTFDKEKIELLIAELSDKYNVVRDDDLKLITIRHYDDEVLERLTKNKTVIFEERLDKTVRSVIKQIPKMNYKIKE